MAAITQRTGSGKSLELELEKDVDAKQTEHVEKINSTWIDTPTVDAKTDELLSRKFDRHVLPWLFALWLLAFIDRSNIGNARIDGLADDLHLDANKFNISLAVFYVPYICIDIPSNLVLKYFKAGNYLPFLVTVWGLISLSIGFVKSYHGLLAARFFLGLAEGGLLGGIIIYLAMFYRRHQMLYRIGLFYCAAPLSGAVGGLLATGLAKIETKHYKGWPFIFFIEGAITVVVGAISTFFLPHTPMHAKFLTPAERASAIARLKLDDHGASSGNVNTESFSWHWVRMAILNWNTILLALDFFAIITPIYSFSLFLPTIIKSLGYTSVKAQLFTVPPNILAFCTVLLTGHLSDKFRKRGVFMLVGCTVAIAGYVMLIASSRPSVQYAGTFLIGSGVFPCSPLVMGWLSNNTAPHYVRATATGFQIMVANMAAFIATFTYLQKDAPRFTKGHAINIGMLAMSLVCTSTLLLYNKWENGKRAAGQRDHRLQEEEEALLGYRHPRFRYTL